MGDFIADNFDQTVSEPADLQGSMLSQAGKKKKSKKAVSELMRRDLAYEEMLGDLDKEIAFLESQEK